MRITIDIEDEIYLKWLDFNAARGVISSGRYAGIGKVNSDLFRSEIIKMMEEV